MDGNWIDFDEDGSPLEMDNFGAAAKEAEAAGAAVLIAGDRQLFLDLDSEASMLFFTRRLKHFDKIFKPHDIMRWRSKSGKGWHVVLTLGTGTGWSVGERVALQIILGSDALKEMLTIAREKLGEYSLKGHTVRLFRPKNAVIEYLQSDGSWSADPEESLF